MDYGDRWITVTDYGDSTNSGDTILISEDQRLRVSPLTPLFLKIPRAVPDAQDDHPLRLDPIAQDIGRNVTISRSS